MELIKMFEDSGLRIWYKISDFPEIEGFIDPALLAAPPPCITMVFFLELHQNNESIV